MLLLGKFSTSVFSFKSKDCEHFPVVGVEMLVPVVTFETVIVNQVTVHFIKFFFFPKADMFTKQKCQVEFVLCSQMCVL